MNKYLVVLYIISFTFTGLYAQDQSNPEITSDELKDHVIYLASDELQGRKAGTEFAKLSADYIKEQFENMGLSLLADDGLQTYELVIDVKAGDKNNLQVGEYTYIFEEDFMPFPFSQNAKLESEVVFAGYGFNIDKDDLQWNDYKDIDVNDKWVLILRGDPEPQKDESAFADFAGIRNKVLTAKDNGAAGVLLVSGPEFSEEDELISLYYDKTQANAGIPVIHIKREIANDLLGEKNTIETLENDIIENKQPNSFQLDKKVKATTDLILEKVDDWNVVAMLEGKDPEMKDSYIIIGAHYDHLGMGGPGSGSRILDTLAVHNGADDNASGVSGIIEIMEKLANAATNKRSIVVIAFGAEEMGLIGSKYFTNNPLIDLEKVNAMINFDMIGRLDMDSKSISVGGTGSSKEAEAILDALQEESEIGMAYSPEGYGPSDHAAFYAENIPVFFISTGAHTDYHTPKDDYDLLNYEGQKIVSELAYQLIDELANSDSALTFQEAGPKRKTGYRSKLKVTFGIMPDFTSKSNDGLIVGGVTPGKPAKQAGMEKGDVIVAINGKEVGNIYDYMNRLKKLEQGQTVAVDVMRDGKKKVLILQL